MHANQLSEAIKNSTLTSMLENKREEVHAIINTVSHEPAHRDPDTQQGRGGDVFVPR